ncbi:Trm112 family protein [Thiomicrospira sp. R3]|uniref:Trm112 family protein n=1 Tax=Thiomicrospira sp. R3 TaxID=3035472 RepID=UPI00259B5DF5|nr:Trm112 family protein [Thiomicrospira sp. R3]WFE68316.1 Trm112 family protein [Thiomicrospira sp. R3]
MSLNTYLLDILVCPVSKTKLVYDKNKQELISTAANLAYPVREGIPVMLEDEARSITAEEAEYFRKLKS